MYKFVLALALGAAAHAADDLKEVHGHGRLEDLDGQIYSLETTFDVAGGRKLTEEELETTFEDDGGFRGNFFDVNVLQDLTIRNFDVHAFQTGPGRVEVWYRPGSYTGNTGSNIGWTLVYEDDAVDLQGTGSHTPLGDFNGGAGLPLAVGRHAFLVYIPRPNFGRQTYRGPKGEGEVYAEDTALQILE